MFYLFLLSMEYSIVIPTYRTYEEVQPLLVSIALQTKQPQNIYIIRDKNSSLTDYQHYKKNCLSHFDKKDIVSVVSNNSDACFVPWSGAWYNRNYGLQQSKSLLTLCVDDDNVFAPDFVEKLLASYQDTFWKDQGVLFPLEEYRKEWRVRFAWYAWFNPWLSRPFKIPYNPNQTVPYAIALAPSNCFLIDTKLAQKHPFDERLPYVYEDLLFFGTLVKQWYSLFLDPLLRTHHMLRQKTKIQDLYVWNPANAYQKWRNRIIYMRQLGTLAQKIIFFWFWLWWQTWWLLLFIRWSAPWNQKISITKALLKWTIDWLLLTL